MAVSQHLDRASEMLFQPFGWHFGMRMIMNRFIHTSNGFYILKHRTDVVAHQDDGTFAIDFFQQGV